MGFPDWKTALWMAVIALVVVLWVAPAVKKVI